MSTEYYSYTTQDYNLISNNCNTITGFISSYNLQKEEILRLKKQVKILTEQKKALKLLLKLNS